MSLHICERDEGGFAFFIDGDLQFDTDDEAVYHESLVLPALCLARPRQTDGLRALICGGGDGLALRECLRFPGVAAVDLVDYDGAVVELGRTRFAELNHHAFEDPRVRVTVGDAWDFVRAAGPYDVAICDVTVPRSVADTRIFSQEWYARLAAALAPGGVAAINAVSPQATPEAFWCIRRTVRSAGLSSLPYRVCIPSFRAQGYGAWAFMLAAHRPLRQADLRGLQCPVSTRQADLTRLWRGSRFTAAARALEARAPLNTLADPCLFRLLLNPGMAADGGLPVGTNRDALGDAPPEPFDLQPLLSAIPVVHPYHTREMLEALAEQVVGTVRAIDIRRLVDALLSRAARLPGDLVRELRRLREFMRDHTPDVDIFRTWAWHCFVALVVTMVLANAIAPDNAFAKGGAGLGHASMSRGYSGGFGGGRGDVGGFGGGSHVTTSGAHVSGTGFRSRGFGRSTVTDINGYSYRPRVFFFPMYHTGHYGYHGYRGTGSGHSTQPAQPPQAHKALFVADDDMMVLDNGDVVVTLSPSAYLLASGGQLTLMSDKAQGPVMDLYPDPKLFAAIQQQVRQQQGTLREEVGARRDWLSWVGWTRALFPVVADDWTEVRNMEDLDKSLTAALARVGGPPANAVSAAAPAGSTELFVGCHLLADGTVAVRGRDHWWYVDGKEMRDQPAPGGKAQPCPPEMRDLLRDVMAKLQKEMGADIASDATDLTSLQKDRDQLNKDMAEYQRLASQYGTGYDVDYGTDEISAGEAIRRTEADLAQNQRDYDETVVDQRKSQVDQQRIAVVLASWGK